MEWSNGLLVHVMGLIVALGGIGASGCGTHYTGLGKVVAVDARDRVVSVNKVRSNDKLTWVTKICAEQSPDAYSLLSGSGSASGEYGGAAGQLAIAFAESGGSLAFRTQVTQAQSNLLFTLCQLNANGSLSEKAVRTEIRRFQHSLLGMLAIEQLTAPLRGSAQQTLLTTSTATAGKDVEIAQQKLKNEQEKLAELETTKAGKVEEKGKLDAAKEDEKKKIDALDAEIAELDKQITTQQKAVAIAEELLSAARLAVSVSAGGQQAVIHVSAPRGPEQVTSEVANAVVESLETVVNRGVLLDNCMEHVMERDGPVQTALCDEIIRSYVTAHAERQKAYSEVVSAQAYLIGSLAEVAMRCAKTGKNCDAVSGVDPVGAVPVGSVTPWLIQAQPSPPAPALE